MIIIHVVVLALFSKELYEMASYTSSDSSSSEKKLKAISKRGTWKQTMKKSGQKGHMEAAYERK